MSTRSKMLLLIQNAADNERKCPDSPLNSKAVGKTIQKPAELRTKIKTKIKTGPSKSSWNSRNYDYSVGDERAKPGDALSRARSGGGWNPR
jgi:hypothetical protein